MEDIEKDLECEVPIKRRRGPHRKYDKAKILELLIENTSKLIDVGSGTVTSVLEKIWQEMADKLERMGQPKSANSLHTYVSCDQDGVRSKLDPTYLKTNVPVEDDPPSPDQSLDLRLDTTERKIMTNVIEFTVHIPTAEFEKLVENRPTFLANVDTGKIVTRNRKRCLSDEWQTYLTDLAWEHERIKHGFSFEYHHLRLDLSSAHFVGHCACEAVLDCYMSEKNKVISLRFVIKGGDPQKKCSKRPLRGKRRADLGRRMENATPHIVRMQMMNDLMVDDDPEPPQIPSSPVMRMLKHETIAAKRLHKDPIKAVQILKATKMINEISTVRCEPLHISYATVGQQKIHRRVAENGILSLKIDSTSGVSRSFKKIDQIRTGPLHLFHAVTRTPSGQQIALGQLLTELQTAGTVQEWLEDWLEGFNLPFPKEVTTDQGKGLLVGCVRALTGYSTVNGYADALFAISEGHPLPPCYIRIDVAHYTKIWVNYLKNVKKGVARFYKGGIGKLIMARSKKDAEIVITCLLTISQSPTCGKTSEGEPSMCEKAKQTMEQIFTSNVFEDLELPHEGQDDDPNAPMRSTVRKRNIQPSVWRDWGLNLNRELVKLIKKSQGDVENELFLSDFPNKLLDELKWLPLWSCISRDDFQYGAVPASSAAVESCFNIIKTWLLDGIQTPRPDYFIALHKDYLDAVSHQARNKMDEYEAKQMESTDSIHTSNDPVSSRMQQERATDSHVTEDDEHFVVQAPMYQSSPLSSNPGCSPIARCEICAAGDLPTGRHRCQDCECAVHIIPPCSYSIGDDEGHGEQRQCAVCHEKTKQPKTKLIQENEAQDHREDCNLKKKKSKFSYLQQTYPPDFFKLKKSLNTIPILRSGDDPALKAIREREIRISLINTGLFDALFHLLLTVATDVTHFLQYIRRNVSRSDFFAMIEYVHKSQRVLPNAYVKRYQVLKPHFFNFEAGHPELSCFTMDCKSTAGDLCEKLLDYSSSFRTRFICGENCPVITERNCVFRVSLEQLQNAGPSFSQLEKKMGQGQENQCAIDSCAGTVSPSIDFNGELVLIEITLEGNEKRQKLELNDIPLEFQTSMMDIHFNLRGIIHIDLPEGLSSGVNSRNLEEIMNKMYCTYVRRNNLWMVIRSCEQSYFCDETTKVSPVLIVYSK